MQVWAERQTCHWQERPRRQRRRRTRWLSLPSMRQLSQFRRWSVYQLCSTRRGIRAYEVVLHNLYMMQTFLIRLSDTALRRMWNCPSVLFLQLPRLGQPKFNIQLPSKQASTINYQQRISSWEYQHLWIQLLRIARHKLEKPSMHLRKMWSSGSKKF